MKATSCLPLKFHLLIRTIKCTGAAEPVKVLEFHRPREARILAAAESSAEGVEMLSDIGSAEYRTNGSTGSPTKPCTDVWPRHSYIYGIANTSKRHEIILEFDKLLIFEAYFSTSSIVSFSVIAPRTTSCFGREGEVPRQIYCRWFAAADRR